MSKHFTIHNFTTLDKSITIDGPDDLKIEVNFDDVDHETVEKNVMRLVQILNERWE